MKKHVCIQIQITIVHKNATLCSFIINFDQNAYQISITYYITGNIVYFIGWEEMCRGRILRKAIKYKITQVRKIFKCHFYVYASYLSSLKPEKITCNNYNYLGNTLNPIQKIQLKPLLFKKL